MIKEAALSPLLKIEPQPTEYRAFLPKETTPDVSAKDSFEAAFKTHNPITSAISNYGKTDYEEEYGYNPFEHDDLTGYEDQGDLFIGSVSREQTAGIKRDIDQERATRKTIDEDGWRGFLFSVAAGTLSPENLLPVGSVVRSYKYGESILKGFGSAAKAGFIASSIGEAALQGTQLTRPMEETAFNIGGATLLSGILGSASAGISTRNFHKIARNIETELKAEAFADSVGSMRVGLEGHLLKSKTTLGTKKLELFEYLQIGPGARLEYSPLDSAKLLGRELEANPSRIVANAEGSASPVAVENYIKTWDGLYGDVLDESRRLYYQFATGQSHVGGVKRRFTDLKSMFSKGRMTMREFNEAVGDAMSRGDVHEVKEVAEAAKMWREKFYDPIAEQAKEVGLLPKDFEFDSITATSYINRAYNTQKIKARRNEFEDEVFEWLREGGSRQAEIDRLSAKIKELDKSKAKDAAKADAIKDEIAGLKKSQRRLADADDAEIRLEASDITDKILKAPGGTLTPSKMADIARASPFHQRAFLIPDERISKWLDRDVEYLSLRMRQHVVPEIELSGKFGDLKMTKQIEAIKSEANSKIAAAKTEAERLRIDKAMRHAVRDAEAIRDRLLGTYMMPDDPSSIAYRASWLARQWNFMTHMGMMTLSAVPDMGKVVFSEGLKRYGRALKHLAVAPKAMRMKMREMRSYGAGVDMVLHTRARAMFEIGDPYGRLTRFESGVKLGSESFGMAALMDPWNAAQKQIAGAVVEDRILDIATAWAKGAAKKADIEKLAASGIGEVDATRIAQKFAEHGEQVDGVLFARIDKWKDPDLVRLYKQAVVREVDNIIVTPGAGDAPLLASTELGKHLFQFKSFGISTIRRTLQSGLQQRDMATLNGTLLMTALGVLSYSAKSFVSGREIEEDPAKLITEGFDHSGILGFLWEAPMMADRTLGLNLFGDGLSRYKTRPQLGALLGPSFGQAERLARVTKAASNMEFSEADTHAARRLVPYHNLFYTRWLFDKMEGRE